MQTLLKLRDFLKGMKDLLLGDGMDFEELGFATMLYTRNNLEAAKNICALKIHSLEDEIQPEVRRIEAECQTMNGKSEALRSHLYDRPMPVSDAKMLALRKELWLLWSLFVVASTASLAGHTATFQMFGWGFLLSLALGATITGIAALVGHFTFANIVVRNKVIEKFFIVTAFALCFWGLVQFAQGRGAMMDRMTSAAIPTSFVDDSPQEPSGPVEKSEMSEQKVQHILSSATVKIMLAADLILGILLGLITKIRTDVDYAAWHELKGLGSRYASLQHFRDGLLSMIEKAKKQCLAGILRALHTATKSSPPYHRHLPILLFVAFVAFGSRPATGQTIKREEVILVDTSQSIGRGSGKSELFRQYLKGVERLLLTEPSDSRVWVSAISTDSFGGVSELLSGWTPSVQGVFTDKLAQAHRQLTSTFETKARELSPAATGTDIFGALWRIRALLDATGLNDASAQPVEKTIWLFSDMMNETKAFEMPALLPSGPAKMLEHAKSAGLMVPLPGYRVEVLGASPAGLTPQSWNILRAFWMAYFREAGAKVEMYSTECAFQR